MENNIGTVEVIYPPEDITIESLADYIAECASVVRDKKPKSAEKLFARLMTESFGSKASRVLEYIPCTIDASEAKLEIALGREQLFGFFKDCEKYRTNMRELLNWGWSLEYILDFVDFNNYIAMKCVTPYFIYGQLSAHNQLTTVSHSQRFGTCDRGFWKPPEVKLHQSTWDEFVVSCSLNYLKEYMKDCKITRKEIWDRGADMLQNRVFTIGGYTDNSNAFPHFINQRTDNHAQLETIQFVQVIKEILKVHAD